MLRKKDYVIYSIFTYIVLILLIYLLRDSRSFKYVCSSDSGCVRFCCDDADTCNEEFIKKNFNESLVPTFLLNHDDLKPEFKIFYGKPICKTTLVSNDTAWMFAWHGDIQLADEIYEADDYCFQDYEIEGKVMWNLFVCQSLASIERVFFFTTTAISAIILLAVIFIFFYFKKLRVDNHGKISMFFLIGISITLLSYPTVQLGPSIIIFTSYVSSLLWLSVMCFDIWWTFKNVRPTSDGAERFKFYCYFSIGLSSLLLIQIIVASLEINEIDNAVRWSLQAVFLFFFALILADIVLLVMTSIKILQMSRSTTFSEHAWFEQEKTRFWTYVQIFAIMFITGPFEMFAMSSYNRHSLSRIFISILRCYSSLIAFAIFVLNDKSRKIIFKRYEVLENDQMS